MWKIHVFRTVEQRTSNVFGVLSIMPNDFFGVLCATFGVSCLPKCSTMWTRHFFVSLLPSIYFQCYDHFVYRTMLRPLSCLTMFCDHNFSLVCRFNLQFSQNYINIDTYEIQHWFCYFVQSLWNKNTIYERSNGRTFYHIFIPIHFISVPYCFVYNYVKHIQPVYT